MGYYLGEPLNDPPPKPEPGSERRRFKRRLVQFAVRYRFNAEGVLSDWKKSEAGNVSVGGLLMVFGENLHIGKEIDLEFILPESGRVIKSVGTIKWLKVVVPDTMVECGLEFLNLAPEDRAIIDVFVNQENEGTDKQETENQK
jgi:c-di-GMP-binding flagellar brake protein YcgR